MRRVAYLSPWTRLVNLNVKSIDSNCIPNDSSYKRLVTSVQPVQMIWLIWFNWFSSLANWLVDLRHLRHLTPLTPADGNGWPFIHFHSSRRSNFKSYAEENWNWIVDHQFTFIFQVDDLQFRTVNAGGSWLNRNVNLSSGRQRLIL